MPRLYAMTRLIAWMFQIHEPSPIKWVFVALAMLNAFLMFTLAWRSRWSWLTIYLPCAAVASLLLSSPLWHESGEVLLILASAGWVISLIPDYRKGLLFTIGLAVLFCSAVHLAAPPPWPHYPADQYYTRFYASAVFFACACSSLLVPLFERKSIPWVNAPAIAWYGAVIYSLVNRGDGHFVTGVAVKLVWSACLMTWIAFSFRGSVAGRRLAGQSRDHARFPPGIPRLVSSSLPWKDETGETIAPLLPQRPVRHNPST